MERQAEATMPDKSREVIVICAGGVRSLLAGETLKAMGYEKVISMDGGYGDWEDAHLPAEIPPPPEETGAPENPDLLKAQIAHMEKVLATKRSKLADIE